MLFINTIPIVSINKIFYTEVKREVRNSFLYVFNIPLLGNFGMEVGGVWREVGNEGGGKKGPHALALWALLRAFYELLAWIEARTVRNAEAVKFCSVLPFLPPPKNASPPFSVLNFFLFYKTSITKAPRFRSFIMGCKK